MAERARHVTPTLRKIEAVISGACCAAIIGLLLAGKTGFIHVVGAVLFASLMVLRLVGYHYHGWRPWPVAWSLAGLVLAAVLLYAGLATLP